MATVVGIICVLTYSYFGGLWTSVMTGTINTLMITVPAAIVVAAVYNKIPGGASTVLDAVGKADPRNLTVLRPDAAAGFGITLAFGLLAATVADQTFWQKVWAIKKRDVSRSFFWAGALFYPIPICLGMLGLVGIAFGLSAADVGGDIAAIGPFIVSHVGLPLALVLLYVLVILAACFSTIDGASAALSSVVAVDIVKRFWPATAESRLFVITKLSVLLGGCRHCHRPLRSRLHNTGADHLRAEDVDPASAGVCHSVVAHEHDRLRRRHRPGDPGRHAHLRTAGELIGTLSIVGMSGATVIIAGLLAANPSTRRGSGVFRTSSATRHWFRRPSSASTSPLSTGKSGRERQSGPPFRRRPSCRPSIW